MLHTSPNRRIREQERYHHWHGEVYHERSSVVNEPNLSNIGYSSHTFTSYPGNGRQRALDERRPPNVQSQPDLSTPRIMATPRVPSLLIQATDVSVMCSSKPASRTLSFMATQRVPPLLIQATDVNLGMTSRGRLMYSSKQAFRTLNFMATLRMDPLIQATNVSVHVRTWSGGRIMCSFKTS
jgi:hypothetical protein